MDVDTIVKRYLPLTEATYYIMLSLVESRHGYGIMQHAENISEGKIKLGPGTLYGALSKLEKEGLIRMTLAEDRKKCYILTDIGRMVLSQEIKRLGILFRSGLQIMDALGV